VKEYVPSVVCLETKKAIIRISAQQNEFLRIQPDRGVYNPSEQTFNHPDATHFKNTVNLIEAL